MLPLHHRGMQSCPNLPSFINNKPQNECMPFAQKTTAVINTPHSMMSASNIRTVVQNNDPRSHGSQLRHPRDRITGDVVATLAPSDPTRTENMLANMETKLNHGGDIPLTTSPGAVEHQLSLHITQALRQHPGAGFLERGRVIIEAIGALLRNDFMVVTGTTPRRLVNFISVGTRTGTIVALTTLMRQLIGFFLEREFQQMPGSSASPRLIAGVASMLLGPGLNVAGAYRDEKTGKATPNSRRSRFVMGLLSAAGLMVTCGYRLPATIDSLMGSFGVQTAVYTLSRDLIQLFFPLHDNGGLNLNGLVCSSLSYGFAQFVLGECMERFAPYSGAGYAMSEGARIADSQTNWVNATGVAAAAIIPYLAHDVLRSFFNALTEVFDDIQRPALMRFFAARRDVPPLKDRAGKLLLTPQIPANSGGGTRIGLERPRIGAGHWPTVDHVAEQFLTTNAMRTSFFAAIVGIAATVGAALNDTGLSNHERVLVVNTVVAGLVIIGYPAFIGAHDKAVSANGEQE